MIIIQTMLDRAKTTDYDLGMECVVSLINEITDNKLIPHKIKDKKALVLGCGAIGNFLIHILSRQGIGRIDVADFDTYDNTNLNRQPYAYLSAELNKCEVMQRRIETIAKNFFSIYLFKQHSSLAPVNVLLFPFCNNNSD